MKKSPDSNPLPLPPNDFADLDRIAGIPQSSRPSDSLVDQVARQFLNRKAPPPSSDTSAGDGRLWRIHKLFTGLTDKYGRPFRMFVGDLLDVLLGGPFQAKFVSDLMEERSRRPSKPAEQPDDGRTNLSVPAMADEDRPAEIGGQACFSGRNFLKRKNLLASLFLDRDEFPAFLKLWKQINVICKEETHSEASRSFPEKREDRQQALKAVVEELKNEITQAGLVRAWLLLNADDFGDLDWVFSETRNLGLVRPTFYEELDKAYREAKKMLKLLVSQFEVTGIETPDQREAIHQYLLDVLDVYTHHHFVLKHFNQTRPYVSRAEVEGKKREWQDRLDSLHSEAQKLREEARQRTIECDRAVAETRTLRQEAEKLRQKLQKLDPVEVQKQLQSMETRVNQMLRERQETIEEDAELRTDLRNLDSENQRLLQKLRELHAIPDEMAKSVGGLLRDKRVVVFGGVGRDHYLAVLKEAGVKDSDYEWYEGYHTISQARTGEIVGRCDVIVVVTSYAGHLHTWQTRNAIGPHQHLFLIHSSGAGSLRQQILEKFKKTESETS